jgi:hypothetical protein
MHHCVFGYSEAAKLAAAARESTHRDLPLTMGFAIAPLDERIHTEHVVSSPLMDLSLTRISLPAWPAIPAGSVVFGE